MHNDGVLFLIYGAGCFISLCFGFLGGYKMGILDGYKEGKKENGKI